jgi:hypothetical protein
MVKETSALTIEKRNSAKRLGGKDRGVSVVYAQQLNPDTYAGEQVVFGYFTPNQAEACSDAYAGVWSLIYVRDIISDHPVACTAVGLPVVHAVTFRG